MSAICGIVNFDGKPVGRAQLARMVASSPFRGPDGVGYHIDKNAGFAFLAFHVTPECVHESQPWVDPDSGLLLVADARIDNRAELQSKLGQELSRLKPLLRENEPAGGASLAVPDSLYILAAFNKWGEACVEYLLGDFVFAVWNPATQDLFLARDALGGHCVHYHAGGSAFLFASEITAILDSPACEPVIREDRVLRELDHLARNQTDTFFEDIHYLAPAHCMSISKVRSRLWRYWDIDPDHRITYRDAGQYSEHLLELVNVAVGNRRRSLGPVGISLSGGHDSTLLAASAKRQSGGPASADQPVHSFSNVFGNIRECDETAYIEDVVAHCAIEAYYIESDEFWSFAKLNRQVIPRDYFWSNCYVQLPLAVAAAAGQSGCKVLIDGQFGDALFGGSNVAPADLLRLGKPFAAIRYLRDHHASGTRLRQFFNAGIRPNLPAWMRRAYRGLYPANGGLFRDGLSPEKMTRLRILRREQKPITSPPGFEPGRLRRYLSLMDAIWPQGQAAVRGIGYNRFGVEPVHPYFDRGIVEFILALQNATVNSPGGKRQLQLDTMRRILPKSVCERTAKTDFSPLLRLGFFEKESGALRQLLQCPQIVERGWVEPGWLGGQVGQARVDDEALYRVIMLVHLELWLRSVRPAVEGKQKWADLYTLEADSAIA